MSNSSDRVVIDVREPFEYKQGHVSGALNIPLSELSAGHPKLNHLDKSRPIITYCNSGNRSGMAVEILRKQGFSNTVNGINAEHVQST